jgi:prolyl-tRNA editing enzyme YbaK/EbsC (Cys-tRNA(Pro) deacylase)
MTPAGPAYAWPMKHSPVDPAPVARVRTALVALGHSDGVRALDRSARTAREAADALGIEVGQIASSIVFGLPPRNGSADPTPLLVVTSGAHRVDTAAVAALLDVPELLRADADMVRRWSGFAIGGVSPVGWSVQDEDGRTPTGAPRDLTVLVDEALGEWDAIWAAAGHPHYVFPTTFIDIVRISGGTPAHVGVGRTGHPEADRHDAVERT